ncbi:bifunctional diaminohydroxyphosphoribosylaminopyrimidine deaminase/5-amino-6-(5-phosphoribosylamino)uracil reductase RibD [Candidatus Margulisiibacteriota bacterium]
MWSEDDLKFMREALSLAKSAEGKTTPDPIVGAVLVKDGSIISMGYHGEVKTPHAEAWAIEKAGKKVKGSTLYTNLEPCSHYGNNPPCVDMILTSGIKEVVAAMKDPNPLVNGKGFRKLKKYGVKVRVGLLKQEAERLNEVFVKYATTKKPFVVLKSAMTLDGKIAARTGASRWVASNEARKFAHHLRNVYDAIVVGVGTVLIDNPKLTTRMVAKIKNPIRIVLDAFARTPLKADVLSKGARTIIVVGPKAKQGKLTALKKRGAEILKVPAPKGKIDLKALLRKLGRMKITSLLVEGGGEVNASFFESGLVNKAHFIIAPKIFGGREAKTPVEGKGLNLPAQAKYLKDVAIEQLGSDILITGYLP